MNNLSTTQTNAKVVTVKNLISQESYKKRFYELLGENAEGFITSVISASKSVTLADAEPTSVLSSAVVAASLDLPIEPNLGFAYIVPYNENKKIRNDKGKDEWIKVKKAQFQMGYKGFIQLALRSGQYKTINAIEIYKGEIIKTNRLTGEIEFKTDTEGIEYSEENIIGYAAYFKLLNGFEKTLYMSKEEVEAHALKYSQSYKSDKNQKYKNSRWSTDFGVMAKKTVIKLLLSKYGPLSIKMQDALTNDHNVEEENVSTDPVKRQEVNSNMAANTIDVDFEEVEETKTEEPIENKTKPSSQLNFDSFNKISEEDAPF